jgi:hypothetical protein
MSNSTVFIVGKQDGLTAKYNTAFETSSDNGIHGTYGDRQIFYDSGSPTANTAPKTIIANASYVYGWDYISSASNGGVNMYINGDKYANTVADPQINSSQSNVGGDSSAEGWSGPLAEVIVYKEVLSQANREKIESYLAIKYGVTLSQQRAHFAGDGSNNSVTSSTATTSIGQTFVPTTSGTVHTISFLAHTSNTATSATVYLCDATVSALATPCIASPGISKVVTLPVNPTTDTLINVQFDSGFAVTAGTTYVFYVKPTANSLYVRSETGDATYASGTMYVQDALQSGVDMIFSVDGFTTDGRDYVASSGHAVFDASESTDTTANSAGIIASMLATTDSDDYVYNVHAIAKDNTNLLINTKSHSASEVIPFLTTEIEDAGLLNDKEFMFVGATNAAASSIVQTDMPVAGIPLASNSRVEREWRVQKNAVISNAVTVNPAMGTFKLTFDLDALNISAANANAYRLIIDDNGNFSSGTQTIYPASGEPTYDALTNTVTFTGVSLVDGQYFTLTIPRTAPGGVTSGLRAWYRAGVGTFDTNSPSQILAVDNGAFAFWKDSSGNQYHLSTIQSNPDFRTGTNTIAINYNPVVDFEAGNNDLMATATPGLFGVSGALVTNLETYGVLNQENMTSLQNGSSHFGFWGGQGFNMIPSLSATTTRWDTGASTLDILNSSTGLVINQPFLINNIAYSTGTAIGTSFILNGKTVGTTATYVGTTLTNTPTYIGSYTSNIQNIDGALGEQIFYNAQHTASEANRIRSYLAVKYGITMAGGESQTKNNQDAATSTAVGQIFTAKTTAHITDVSFMTRSATANSGSLNLYFCTGAVVTTPNSTNVAACIASPDYTQAV